MVGQVWEGMQEYGNCDQNMFNEKEHFQRNENKNVIKRDNTKKQRKEIYLVCSHMVEEHLKRPSDCSHTYLGSDMRLRFKEKTLVPFTRHLK